jgi:anti-sigma factor RsiW
MGCAEAREAALDERRGREAPGSAQLREHLASCEACRAFAERERALTDLLEAKLPRRAAPLSLLRRLAEQWPEPAPEPRRLWGFWGAGLAAAAACALVAVGTAQVVRGRDAAQRLDGEAVNDHLRVLEGAPLSKVAGGLHEVKPWFEGKLDFAPEVAFAGDDDFPLKGGAVEPFLDRRAAIFVYQRRLHVITLFVVRAEGLSFPEAPRAAVVRGFNVVRWRAGDQGYSLTSELSLPELLQLARRLRESR